VHKSAQSDSVVLEKLDTVIRLLQDLFILEAAKGKMKQQEIRKVVGLDIVRVNRIAKHLKAGGEDDGKGSPRPQASTKA